MFGKIMRKQQVCPFGKEMSLKVRDPYE